jgi:serine protease Do
MHNPSGIGGIDRCVLGFALRSVGVLCIALTATRLAAQTPAGKADLLHQLSGSFETLVKKVSPCVVQVQVTGYGAVDEGSRSETGLVVGRQRVVGSGAIIDPDGYIVTNAHVVNNGQHIQVVLPPTGDTTAVPGVLNARSRSVEARVVGVSRDIDLALLKIDVTGLPALPIGRYAELRQGEIVFAFGSPEGLHNTVTMGVVSSVARQLDPDSPLVYIQTDAPINPGNSGGPLVNADGELVGLNTFILSESGGNEGLGFAIPSVMVSFAYPQLKKYGHIHRGEMGVAVQSVTPALATGLHLARDWGVIVSDVMPGGPAASAGLKIQDIILSVDGRNIDSLPLFGFTLFTQPPREALKIDVLRGTDRVPLDIPVIERMHHADQLTDLVNPEENLVKRLGILGVEIDSKVASLVPDLRDPTGVIVVARAAGSAGGENSLTTGDVIHAVNGSPITSMAGLRSALDKMAPGVPMVLQIERDQSFTFVTLLME